MAAGCGTVAIAMPAQNGPVALRQSDKILDSVASSRYNRKRASLTGNETTDKTEYPIMANDCTLPRKVDEFPITV